MICSRAKIIAFGFSLAFFVAGLATLSHYGVNWDATSHLSRGQAYLHYYLTGEKNYSNLPAQKYFQKPDTILFSPNLPKNEIPRISIYQNADRDLNYVLAHYDYGHPHISDVLSSIFNFVLFQKLGLLNDVDSYRVYSVLLSSLLVGLVFWWTASLYGKFSGFVAALSLSLYPLFWSESHFNNEKDIPETVFWSFMLFSLWRGITTKSWKWVLLSGVFFGLAVGTKFNVLFSIFVILPWLASYLISKSRRTFSARLVLAAVAAPILGISIVIGTWPNFWTDPVHKIARIVDFYKTIGTTGTFDQRFIGPLGINIYAVQWILYTTPLVILFLAFLGIVVILSRRFKEKDRVSLLFLLWFIVPIARVTWPGTNIYGGVRQIMEFVPAMAIIAGVGGTFLRNWMISKHISAVFASVLLLIFFTPITWRLIQIHPNENVYFNPLIGGLAGAKERNFPGWGVSFGAPYREAIAWINRNAEPGAKLTLGYEILSNIPGIWIRPDIDYKSNRSGYLRQGEYVISLVFDGTERRSYFDMYLDRMIESVHQVTVDGVPILKIWKNDRDHLKPEWRNESVLDNIKFTKSDNVISFDVGQKVKLSRMEVKYDDSNCPELDWGYLMVSIDGKEWERIPGVLPEEIRIRPLGEQPANGKFIEPFAGQVARYINFFVFPKDTCVTQIESVKLHYFN